jgi:hypothetical protein
MAKAQNRAVLLMLTLELIWIKFKGYLAVCSKIFSLTDVKKLARISRTDNFRAVNKLYLLYGRKRRAMILGH